MLTWLLVYLLIGFVLDFVGSVVVRDRGNWKHELGATLLWPLTLVVSAVVFVQERRS